MRHNILAHHVGNKLIRYLSQHFLCEALRALTSILLELNKLNDISYGGCAS